MSNESAYSRWSTLVAPSSTVFREAQLHAHAEPARALEKGAAGRFIEPLRVALSVGEPRQPSAMSERQQTFGEPRRVPPFRTGGPGRKQRWHDVGRAL
jgi:hypothetical protein